MEEAYQAFRYATNRPTEFEPQSTQNEAGQEEESRSIPLTLTSGVELEFMHFQDTMAENAGDFGRKHIHATLSEPLVAKCAICDRDIKFQLDLNDIFLMEFQEAEDPTYKAWTVKVDNSIELTEPELSNFRHAFESIRMTKIEIASRILDASDCSKLKDTGVGTDHECRITADEEIRAVSNRLNERYNSTSSLRETRAAVNSSCGLHVHIGNGTKGFPLQTVKNLLSLYVAHERAIDSLHSTDRITGSTHALAPRAEAPRRSPSHHHFLLPGDVYNIPWSVHFLQGAFAHIHGLEGAAVNAEVPYHPRKYPDNVFHTKPELIAASKAFDVPSWLTLIENATSLAELRCLQGADRRRSTINLLGLEDFCSDGVAEELRSQRKMTIEFRQAAGTLQPAEVCAWHNMLVALVEYAHVTSAEEIRRRCLETWNSPTLSALDFLKLLGFSRSSSTYQHYESKLGLQQDSAKHYVPHIREEERKAAFKYGDGDIFKPVLASFVKGRSERMEPSNVRLRIEEKLWNGGYGLMEKRVMKRLGVRKERRRFLRVDRRAEEEKEEENGQAGYFDGEGIRDEDDWDMERRFSWQEDDGERFTEDMYD